MFCEVFHRGGAWAADDVNASSAESSSDDRSAVDVRYLQAPHEDISQPSVLEIPFGSYP